MLSTTTTTTTETDLTENFTPIPEVILLPFDVTEPEPSPLLQLKPAPKKARTSVAASDPATVVQPAAETGEVVKRTKNPRVNSGKPRVSDELSAFLGRRSASAEKVPSSGLAQFDAEHREMMAWQGILDEQQKLVARFAVSQCSMLFAQTVILELITGRPSASSELANDSSEKLMAPIEAFGLLRLSALTTEMLENLCTPLFKALSCTLDKPHEIGGLFGILGTVLNFGLRLSDAAQIWTAAHLPILQKLCPFVTQIIDLLWKNMQAAIGASVSQDGFDFADDVALAGVSSLTQSFLQYSKAFNIPDHIAQVIVVETCASCDVLLFNVIITTAMTFTDEKVTSLLQKVRRIQNLFKCLPTNFDAAFPHLLGFITLTKSFWAGVHEIRERTVLVRSIIERCDPPIQLPTGTTLDSIGEHVDNRSTLKLPSHKMTFEFSYEWLYTNAQIQFA
jgi:hypothetical protein